jgi:hypothetical protein
MADYRVKFTISTSLVSVRFTDCQCLGVRETGQESVTGVSETEWTALSVIRSMRWAGHVACLGGREIYTGFGGKACRRRFLKDIGMDWMIVLKWIFKKQDDREWTGLKRPRKGTSGKLL